MSVCEVIVLISEVNMGLTNIMNILGLLIYLSGICTGFS